MIATMSSGTCVLWAGRELLNCSIGRSRGCLAGSVAKSTAALTGSTSGGEAFSTTFNDSMGWGTTSEPEDEPEIAGTLSAVGVGPRGSGAAATVSATGSKPGRSLSVDTVLTRGSAGTVVGWPSSAVRADSATDGCIGCSTGSIDARGISTTPKSIGGAKTPLCRTRSECEARSASRLSCVRTWSKT